MAGAAQDPYPGAHPAQHIIGQGAPSVKMLPQNAAAVVLDKSALISCYQACKCLAFQIITARPVMFIDKFSNNCHVTGEP
jgi:hypothetical protein